MKATLLAPRQSVREIASPADASRMLASGSWVRASAAQTRKPSSARARQYKRRRRAAGWQVLNIFVSPKLATALRAAKREGETLAELIERLLLGSSQ